MAEFIKSGKAYATDKAAEVASGVVTHLLISPADVRLYRTQAGTVFATVTGEDAVERWYDVDREKLCDLLEHLNADREAYTACGVELEDA